MLGMAAGPLRWCLQLCTIQGWDPFQAAPTHPCLCRILIRAGRSASGSPTGFNLVLLPQRVQMDRKTQEQTDGCRRTGSSAAPLPAGSGAGLQPGRLRSIIPCFSVSIETPSPAPRLSRRENDKVTLATPTGPALCARRAPATASQRCSP